MMRWFLALAMAMPVFAIDLGVRGGLPFGDAFERGQNRQFNVKGANQFVVGPTLELRLPLGFGASFDALYRRYSFQTDQGNQGAAQWEFPLMLRYRFPGVIVRPFVAAGPIFTKITGVTAVKNSQGLALGGGLDISLAGKHLTPELRYSRRFQDVVVQTRYGSLQANANQIDLMVGFTF
jgi:hypothetical protein